ncbi:MAG: hypothetical protein ACTSR8_09165 [Promethearchaeota archaeon]
MKRKSNNNKNKFLNWLCLFIIISILSFPTALNNKKMVTDANIIDQHQNIPDLNIQGFSINDYEPILEEEKQALGSITISDINFLFDNLGFYLLGSQYPLLDDYKESALNMTFKEMTFINTIRNARVDNLNKNLTDNFKISVRLNETIKVWYNLSQPVSEGYLIYGPRFYPCHLQELSVVKNESTEVIKLNETKDYEIDNYNFLYFNYEKFFKSEGNVFNFTMYLIWEYNLTVSDWQLTQFPNKILINSKEETISPKFNYQYHINGQRFNESELVNFGKPEDYLIDANNIEINVTAKLPDKNVLENHVIKINGVKIANSKLDEYLQDDFSISTNFISAKHSDFYLNFTADFRIKFDRAVEETWAIDRLSKNRDIRQRIYFPFIISGPERIYVKNLYIYEDTISNDQVRGNETLFGRGFAYFKANVSEYDEQRKNSLVFTENITQKQGLKIFLPYLIKNEICPAILTYKVTRSLQIIVTDNIQMPLAGLEVKLYYYGLEYGTYISKNKVQPMATLITDDTGEVNAKFVPNGNYTVKIYQNDNLIWETSVSTYINVNYVVTNIIHFPLWIIIFSTINGILILVGVIIYLKYKKDK